MTRRLIHVIFFIILYNSCANITTPQGGPKDVAAPKLISSAPAKGEKNFAGKTVELTFDEYVTLKSPKEEIIISPSVGEDVDFKFKQNRIFVTPKEGWKPETTYSIQFREGVRDITEGNVPPNLKLAFSTGPTIDSLRFSGIVTDIMKGTPVDKFTVAIYPQDTFNIFTHKPTYFTRTDKTGKFTLDNIKNGNYYIYAWDDKNKNLKVESKGERYGFVARKLALASNVDTIKIGTLMLDSRELKLSNIRNVGNVTRIRFNKTLTDYTIESDSALINNFGDTQSDITIWNPETKGDSLKVMLSVTDSLLSKLDTTFYIRKTDIKPVIDRFTWSVTGSEVDSETGMFTSNIVFNKPITNINIDSINILRDTVNTIPFDKKDLTIDLKNKKITVKKEISKDLFKAEKDPYFQLAIGKGFLVSIDNDSTKKQKSAFPTLWPEDTGKLSIEILTKQKHYLVQLVTTDFKILETVKDIRKYTFKNIQPGDYQIRVIIDENNNGVWDSGNIMKRQEPEMIVYYLNSQKKTGIPLRANWEVGPLVIAF